MYENRTHAQNGKGKIMKGTKKREFLKLIKLTKLLPFNFQRAIHFYPTAVKCHKHGPDCWSVRESDKCSDEPNNKFGSVKVVTDILGIISKS